MINRLVRFTLATALVAFATAATADAQTALNNRTVMTFSHPVEVPGKVLPAGTYTFELNDSGMNRRVIQIFDEGGTKLQALVLAVASYRAKATEETVVSFAEVAPGQPQAIRYWYYPGQTAGHELVYSASRARELAAAANASVQSTADTTYVDANLDAMKAAEVKAVEPEKKAEVVAAQPERVVTQPEPVVTAPAPMRNELPRTASTLPMVMLVGGALLALGLALRGLTPAKVKR